MSTYRAVATREGKFWVVDVEGVGVTQGRSLAEARAMAADLVAVMNEVDPATYDVDFRVELPGALAVAVADARGRTAEAEVAQREAAAASRRVAADLRGAGLSGRDAAFLMGISEQRVSQLLAPLREVAAAVANGPGGRVVAAVLEGTAGQAAVKMVESVQGRVPSAHEPASERDTKAEAETRVRP